MRGLLRTLFSIHGAAGRREWWFAYFATIVVIMAIGLALMSSGAIYALLDAAADQPLLAGLMTLAMLALMAPTSIRRMRARRLSPWWLAAFAAWAALSPFVVRLADDLDALILGNVIQIVGVIGGLVLFTQLAVLPSVAAPPELEPPA